MFARAFEGKGVAVAQAIGDSGLFWLSLEDKQVLTARHIADWRVMIINIINIMVVF